MPEPSLTGPAAPPRAREAIRVVIAELASNAVRHAGTPYTVTVTEDSAGSVTVSVRDGSPTLPVLRALEPGSSGGRGMRIVEGLVAQWGTDLEPGDGKTVWALIDPAS